MNLAYIQVPHFFRRLFLYSRRLLLVPINGRSGAGPRGLPNIQESIILQSWIQTESIGSST